MQTIWPATGIPHCRGGDVTRRTASEATGPMRPGPGVQKRFARWMQDRDEDGGS